MESEGIPDLETPINQDEGLIPPRDHPQAVDEFGITAAEQRLDEPLSLRVLREEPDFGSAAFEDPGEDDVGGRLVAPGSQDVDDIDDEKDEIASLVGDDDGALSAEEAAMHITDLP